MQPSKSNLSSTFTAPIMQNEDTRYSRYSTISTDIEYKDSPYRHSIPATVIQKKEDDDRVNTNLPFRNALFWDHLKDDTDMDDDGLHTFDVKSKAPESSGFYPFSGRGWLNFGMIGVLIGALLMLFAGCELIFSLMLLSNCHRSNFIIFPRSRTDYRGSLQSRWYQCYRPNTSFTRRQRSR